MIEALGFFWLRPWWLAALPVAALLGIVAVERARGLGDWMRAIDQSVLAEMRRLGLVAGGRPIAAWLPALLLALLSIALAGPAEERRDLPTFRNLDGVVVVLDVSESVGDGGRFADMLTTARLVAASAGSRQIALIVYAGEAYVASAFTTDARALGATVSLIEPDLSPVPGSRPGAALALARSVLADAHILASDVVLLSDGEGIGQGTQAEARSLRRQGAALSAVFVPSSATGGDGRAALAALARQGGGQAGDLADPSPVIEILGHNARARLAEAGYPTISFSDRGRYLLLFALVPALLTMPGRKRA